jgi:hypothetical protein
MMESLTSLPGATLEALIRDWTLWVAILSITLVFIVYLYLFPKAMEFFADCNQKQNQGHCIHRAEAAGPGKNAAQQ